jgi:hypothetical protein
MSRVRYAIVFVIALTLLVPLQAQRRGRFGGLGQFGWTNSIGYDGRLTIVRLWYPYYGGWSYDYPDMEQNFTLILNELTYLRARRDGSMILRMDDPELMKFPISYLSEPGYWYPSDIEAAGLRTYLDKGGFLIVDDFHFPEEWSVFEAAMKKVLPQARIDRLQLNNPVFSTFFAIKSLEVPYPGTLGERGLMGEFFGIYEDNDPTKRLMVVVNYNMDIGDYMEHSGRGWYSVAPTNEAFKFGVNYFLYGLTH